MEKEIAYKYSRQREALFQLLASTKSHPTAAWLYNKLKKDFPQLSQGTVYRNLHILAEQKRIRILDTGSGFAHFDADMSVHNHVICTKCGRIDDAPLTAAVCQETAAVCTGYHIDTYRLDFFGICPDCQKKNNGKKEKYSA